MRCFGKFEVETECVGDVSAVPAGSEPYERKIPGVDTLMKHSDLSRPEEERNVAILSGGMLDWKGEFLKGLFGALG